MDVYKVYIDDATLSLFHVSHNQTKWVMAYDDDDGNEVRFDVGPELLQQIVEVMKAAQ